MARSRGFQFNHEQPRSGINPFFPESDLERQLYSAGLHQEQIPQPKDHIPVVNEKSYDADLGSKYRTAQYVDMDKGNRYRGGNYTPRRLNTAIIDFNDSRLIKPSQFDVYPLNKFVNNDFPTQYPKILSKSGIELNSKSYGLGIAKNISALNWHKEMEVPSEFFDKVPRTLPENIQRLAHMRDGVVEFYDKFRLPDQVAHAASMAINKTTDILMPWTREQKYLRNPAEYGMPKPTYKTTIPTPPRNITQYSAVSPSFTYEDFPTYNQTEDYREMLDDMYPSDEYEDIGGEPFE